MGALRSNVMVAMIAITTVGTLGGCDNSKKEANTSGSSNATTSTQQMTVGVLIPGSKTDKGWMSSGFDGVQEAKKQYGDKLKTQIIENINYADMDQALTTLASKNQMVIGVGGQTQASVFKVAKKFPNVKFVVIGGNKEPNMPNNVAGYDVKQAEIFFAAGAAAAMMSKSGVVSYVGGMEIPAIVNAGNEYANGAKYINPKIKVITNYTGDFENVTKAQEATLAAISQGADIHAYIMNLGTKGIEQAAKEKGTHIIGGYFNRCADKNPLYVAYSTTGVGYQVEYAIDQLDKGTWKAGYKPFGLAMGNKSSDFAICNGTPEQNQKMEQIKQDLQNGKIKVAEG
ncbi:BMP family protein [Acinetobacter sp. WU_MDCI_Axc73]|nr:BMP family protein [Acinetobacter sp. WU_MDCI_Axc73]